MNIKTIELFGKSVFSWVTFDQLHSSAAPMPDNEAAFIFILAGACVIYAETDVLKVAANNALLVKCGNSRFRTIPVNENPVYSVLSVRFHKDILDHLYADSTSPFYKQAGIPLMKNMVQVDINPLFEQYIQNLLSYFDHPNLLTEEFLKVKLKELIVLLLQTDHAPQLRQIMNNLFEKKSFEFKEIIKSHICSALSIEELAQLTNLSLSAFKKKFRQVYNDSPGHYIIDQRIQKVAELLPKSAESITNIAYDCEFKTLAHMSRVFKAKYGISPSEYRLSFSDKK